LTNVVGDKPPTLLTVTAPSPPFLPPSLYPPPVPFRPAELLTCTDDDNPRAPPSVLGAGVVLKSSWLQACYTCADRVCEKPFTASGIVGGHNCRVHHQYKHDTVANARPNTNDARAIPAPNWKASEGGCWWESFVFALGAAFTTADLCRLLESQPQRFDQRLLNTLIFGRLTLSRTTIAGGVVWWCGFWVMGLARLLTFSVLTSRRSVSSNTAVVGVHYEAGAEL